MKQWSNARGAGELFNLDMVDVDGTQIQGTFFNQNAQKYFQIIKENGVYIVSNGNIKLANRRFTSIPNDYCISFNEDVEFVEVAEDAAISQEAWNFKSIKALSEMQT